MQGKKLQQWQIDRIAQADATNKELYVELGLSRPTVTKHALALGITLPQGRKPLSENVNHHFFDEWSPDVAYILGYIYADGCIAVTRQTKAKVIAFGTAEKDRAFLQQIADLLGWALPLHKACRFRVCSPVMYDRLIELGVTPAKSLTLQWPSIVPGELLNHFVRGYCDGDGCVRIDAWANRNHLDIRLVGTQHFLAGLKKTYTRITGNDVGSLHPASQGARCWELGYHGNISARAFAAWMYWASTPQTRLDRKYQAYQRFLAAHS